MRYLLLSMIIFSNQVFAKTDLFELKSLYRVIACSITSAAKDEDKFIVYGILLAAKEGYSLDDIEDMTTIQVASSYHKGFAKGSLAMMVVATGMTTEEGTKHMYQNLGCSDLLNKISNNE